MKQIEVAQLEYFKVFLEDLLSLITLHIYSVNTQLQQVVFCYLNTNKLFLWETNAPIGVTSCSIWKLWIYGAGVKQINRIWCNKICFPEDSHPWPTEHQGQLLEPAGQQGLGKLHCIHKPLLVWSADWTKISEYPFYCYRLQITDYKANHEFLNLIIIMLNKLLYEVWKVFGRLKH